MNKKEIAESLVFGLAGGLMAYGYYGTPQAAALGAGIGIIVIPVLIIATIILKVLLP